MVFSCRAVGGMISNSQSLRVKRNSYSLLCLSYGIFIFFLFIKFKIKYIDYFNRLKPIELQDYSSDGLY